MNRESQIESILAIHGGPADWTKLPSTFPLDDARNLEQFLKERCESIAPLIGLESIAVRFTRSTGITANLHALADQCAVIAIPIGLLARFYAFARRVWSYADRKKKGIKPKAALVMATSPADYYNPAKFIVPPKVRAILSDFRDESEFWAELASFETGNPHEESIDFNVTILLNQALALICSHELAHLFYRHTAFLAFFEDFLKEKPIASPETLSRMIRKGVELEADYFAGTQLAGLLAATISREGPYTAADWSADFFRTGFGLVVLLGVFDPHMRSLGAYDRRSYAHPIVRHQAIRTSITTFFKSHPQLMELWRSNGMVGWFEAEQCITWFTVRECMDGANANSMIPIHALVYGGKASEPYISSEIRHGQAIFDATRQAREHFAAGTFTDECLEPFFPLLARPESGFADGEDFRALETEER